MYTAPAASTKGHHRWDHNTRCHEPERKSETNKPPVHTVTHGDGWANKREGADTVAEVFDTKAAAEGAGKATAQREKVEHLFHKKDGAIGERNSYGNDPYPPKG